MILSTYTKGQTMSTITTTKTEVVISEDVTQLDPTMEAIIVEFNEAKAAIKALEAKKAAAENAIREALKGNDVGLINGVERVRVQHRNLSKIDRESLKTAFPEAYAAVLSESAYTVLQAK
jgi:predicted phage-related endonuclease